MENTQSVRKGGFIDILRAFWKADEDNNKEIEDIKIEEGIISEEELNVLKKSQKDIEKGIEQKYSGIPETKKERKKPSNKVKLNERKLESVIEKEISKDEDKMQEI